MDGVHGEINRQQYKSIRDWNREWHERAKNEIAGNSVAMRSACIEKKSSRSRECFSAMSKNRLQCECVFVSLQLRYQIIALYPTSDKKTCFAAQATLYHGFSNDLCLRKRIRRGSIHASESPMTSLITFLPVISTYKLLLTINSPKDRF